MVEVREGPGGLLEGVVSCGGTTLPRQGGVVGVLKLPMFCTGLHPHGGVSPTAANTTTPGGVVVADIALLGGPGVGGGARE